MKKIGIVGGVGWRSTVDYYAEICRRAEDLHLAQHRPGPPASPEIAIESLDLNQAFAMIGNDEDESSWSRFDEYHRAALMRLERSGAEVALIASNTPHHRFREITRGVRIPVVNIVAAAAQEAVRLRARRLLILGTSLTMSSPRIRREFARRGIEAAGLADDAARTAVLKLIEELQRGHDEGTAERLMAVARTAFTGQFRGSPAVCLACTELPLAFPENRSHASFVQGGITWINTSAAHVAAVVELAFAANSSGAPAAWRQRYPG
jgi:aspartate racemase